VVYDVVNLDTLSQRFDAGDEVTPATLYERRLIGRRVLVKVLARGNLSKKLIVKAHRFSAKASKLITAAGGHVEVLAGQRRERSP